LSPLWLIIVVNKNEVGILGYEGAKLEFRCTTNTFNDSLEGEVK